MSAHRRSADYRPLFFRADWRYREPCDSILARAEQLIAPNYRNRRQVQDDVIRVRDRPGIVRVALHTSLWDRHSDRTTMLRNMHVRSPKLTEIRDCPRSSHQQRFAKTRPSGASYPAIEHDAERQTPETTAKDEHNTPKSPLVHGSHALGRRNALSCSAILGRVYHPEILAAARHSPSPRRFPTLCSTASDQRAAHADMPLAAPAMTITVQPRPTPTLTRIVRRQRRLRRTQVPSRLRDRWS